MRNWWYNIDRCQSRRNWWNRIGRRQSIRNWCYKMGRSQSIRNLRHKIRGNNLRHRTDVANWFSAQLICPIQLHVKRQNSSICKFFQDIAWPFFFACEWQDLSFNYQKSEKATYLDNLVFSAFSVLWGTVKKFRLKSDRRHTLPGECAGESVTK